MTGTLAARVLRCAIGSAVATCLLSACAIRQLQDDVSATQHRVDDKQAQLDGEQRRQAALEGQRRQLLAELNRRELPAAELSARLERMIRLNEASASAAAGADAQARQRRDERARQLDEAASQARRIEQDTAAPPAEKVRRLDALKEKTRKMLELLLVG